MIAESDLLSPPGPLSDRSLPPPVSPGPGSAGSLTDLYVLRDIHGAVLYVGISGRWNRRMTDHSTSKPWWGDVASATLSHFGTRREAEQAEATLIATLRPVHNQAGMPSSPTLTTPAVPDAPKMMCPNNPAVECDCIVTGVCLEIPVVLDGEVVS